MPLLRLIRTLFPKFEPLTVNLDGLGEATSDRSGYWTVRRPVELGGARVVLCFKTSETPPGDSETTVYQSAVDNWPLVWSSILCKLRKDLKDDGPDGELEHFLKDARPVGVCFEDGLRLWEVVLEPDIFHGHMVTMTMKGWDCEGFSLDG